ncbi:DUF1566 domain-containing protein [Aestuariibacter sp. GS-14]|uniref:Lcl C-terminal domain-containing protein n=1 Tax=Aestuariibacter sp. GS-14 TaxID=2590670 RepID=UPI00112CCDFC|nr:DUF1566 domain-containing protein [Aestuariibacter sp. GS-14]TPV57302.1 DUF1566 domain-containing protein [Aestuariibacter sp. GS-14]
MTYIRLTQLKLFALIMTALLLTACGGLSKETASETFAVNAGRDRTIAEQSSISLSAQVSYPSGDVTYRWTAPSSITISQEATTSSAATLTAPAVTSETQFTISVTATDASSQTATDSFVLTVTPQNSAPTAVITVADWPDSDPGTYPAGVSVTLDGRNSFDSDNTDSNAIAKWLWEQTAGSDVLTGLEADQSTLIIATPIADNRQTLTFSLTVTDQEGATNSTTYSITVLSAFETQPQVSAGMDQAVFGGEIILLDGTASSSLQAAYPLSALWTYSGDSEPTIVQATQTDTYAIAPLVTSTTSLEFYLTVEDSYGNVVTETKRVTVRPFPVRVLNDTGMSLQANNTANGTSHQNAWPGQDAHKGADALASAGILNKAGRGQAGFDFTKLNANGDEQDDDVTQFSCVRDNVTGLVWEIKTTDGGLRDQDHLYSWYSTDNNGGAEGSLNGTSTQCSITNCNTEEYIAAINSAGLCGFYDWRLPTHGELLSLVHFGKGSSPRIDTQYFPYTGNGTASALWYWTSLPSADGVSNDAAQNAWAIDFISGVDNFLNKSSAASIRLVRAGR